MIRELDVDKKDDLSKLLATAPRIKDLEIRSRLHLLRSDHNNDNFQPPLQLPQTPQPPQPSRRDNFFHPQAPPPQTPRQNDFFGPAPRIPPSPSPSPLPKFNWRAWKIEKSEKKNENFKVDTSLSSYFKEAEEILDRNYLEKIENEKEELKEIEREYNFSHILEQKNGRVTPEETEFYFDGDN